MFSLFAFSLLCLFLLFLRALCFDFCSRLCSMFYVYCYVHGLFVCCIVCLFCFYVFVCFKCVFHVCVLFFNFVLSFFMLVFCMFLVLFIVVFVVFLLFVLFCVCGCIYVVDCLPISIFLF